MKTLGMLTLGIFIGWVVSYGLLQIHNWDRPANVYTAVISEAVSGGVFVFIQYLDKASSVGDALFMYPVGLAYGSLCNSLGSIGYSAETPMVWLHIAAFFLASGLLLAFVFDLFGIAGRLHNLDQRFRGGRI